MGGVGRQCSKELATRGGEAYNEAGEPEASPPYTFGGECSIAMYPRMTFVVLMLCVYAFFGGLILWMGFSAQHAAILVAVMIMVTGAFWQKTQ
jgi:hypothetical protein